MESLFVDKNIQVLAKEIAVEFENRNIFPLTKFPQFLRVGTSDYFSKKCQNLQALIKRMISDKSFFKKLLDQNQNPWIKSAVWFGTKNGVYDFDMIAMHLCAGIIQKHFRKIDDQVQHLNDDALNKKLQIPTNKDLLVDLSDKRILLKNHGIIFNGNVLIYPHQFFRRFYSANFVGMPSLLKKAQEQNARVYIRLDPFRETQPNRYQEIMEFDYWYGPRFSDSLLTDRHKNDRTLHTSNGYYCLSYDVKFTAFRTKMMDHLIREFMIEEYCPLALPYGEKSPGIGEKFCIQKFAHFAYDQDKKYFTHLDGAVRVFTVSEYKTIFETMASGSDPGDKIGNRHKMFLAEGQLNTELVKELITEWFRYNPHIQEYFSGSNIPPAISYQDFEKLHKN